MMLHARLRQTACSRFMCVFQTGLIAGNLSCGLPSWESAGEEDRVGQTRRALGDDAPLTAGATAAAGDQAFFENPVTTMGDFEQRVPIPVPPGISRA